MRRLLIVDDEKHVVNWLYELLSLETSLELELYRAYSAKEALDTLSETKIDVVLTDIKMPGMTGLELMEHIYTRWPFCRVIVLTGHQNFDDIYHSERNYPEAIYLMKTEDDDVILDSVRQQLSKIDAEIRTLQIRDEYEYKSLMAAQNLFLKNLSDGKVIDRIQPIMDELHIGLDVSEPFILAVGKLTNAEGRSCYTYLFEIQSIVYKYVSHIMDCGQWTENGDFFYWLLQPLNDSVTQVNTRDLFEDVQSAFYELLGFESSFVISDFFSFPELSAKAAQMLNQLKYNAGAGVTAVLMENRMFSDEEVPPISMQKLESMETNLFLGKRELFLSTLSAALEPIAHVRSMHHSGALELFSSIALILQRHINRINARDQLAFSTGLYKLNNTEAFSSWVEASSFLTGIAVMLFDMRNERKEGYQLQIIGSIKQYVQNNLGEPLSLVTIADMMKYNPSYISRMFKKIEGVNLSDYINAARMAEAKRLLLQERSTMNEIAAIVGYDSPQYFATVFRKLTGLSPHQFQLEHLIRDENNSGQG